MKKVKSMSFEEKSRWLRCNPVTAAKHLSESVTGGIKKKKKKSVNFELFMLQFQTDNRYAS